MFNLKMYVFFVFYSVLFLSLRCSGQVMHGGTGTISDPYFRSLSPVFGKDGYADEQGQDYESENNYGDVVVSLRQKKLHKVIVLNGFGVPDIKSMSGFELTYDFTSELDSNCNFNASSKMVEESGTRDSTAYEIKKTYVLNSNYDGGSDSGTRNGVAKIFYTGTLKDTISHQLVVGTYQWPETSAPWSMSVERPQPGIIPPHLQGDASYYTVTSATGGLTIPDPLVLNGSHLDWLWDALLVSMLLSTPARSLWDGLNQVPEIWSDYEMKWMWPNGGV